MVDITKSLSSQADVLNKLNNPVKSGFFKTPAINNPAIKAPLQQKPKVFSVLPTVDTISNKELVYNIKENRFEEKSVVELPNTPAKASNVISLFKHQQSSYEDPLKTLGEERSNKAAKLLRDLKEGMEGVFENQSVINRLGLEYRINDLDAMKISKAIKEAEEEFPQLREIENKSTKNSAQLVWGNKNLNQKLQDLSMLLKHAKIALENYHRPSSRPGYMPR